MGSDKVGANYAACLYPRAMAAQDGFGEVLFLDPTTHTLLEETSSSNVILRFRGERDLVTPESPSILPSISLDSVIKIATVRGISVKRRPIRLEELAACCEFACVGTAAGVFPADRIVWRGRTLQLEESDQSLVRELSAELDAVRRGRVRDQWGWTTLIPTRT
jgi:branched-chain amino acid aminotransferase